MSKTYVAMVAFGDIPKDLVDWFELTAHRGGSEGRMSRIVSEVPVSKFFNDKALPQQSNIGFDGCRATFPDKDAAEKFCEEAREKCANTGIAVAMQAAPE